MQLSQCVEAYMAVMELSEQAWSYKAAHALLMLKRKLQPHAEFFAKEENGLVEAYAKRDDGGKVVWGKTGFVLRDEAAAEAYRQRREELGAVEVEIEGLPVQLPLPEKIRPRQLEALEGYIEWSERS